MGKRSLRRLLRGRAGRAWSQTTGGRKKALTIDLDFTHSPACLLTLPITNVFCFYVFWNKNQIRMKKKQLVMLTTRVVNGAQRCVRRCVRRRRGRCGGERRAHRDGRAVVSSLRSRPSEARSDDACDKGAADKWLVQQEATRGGERLAQQAE